MGDKLGLKVRIVGREGLGSDMINRKTYKQKAKNHTK